jgi:hypothetical protein
MSIQFNLIPEGEYALIAFLRAHHYEIVLKEEIALFAVQERYREEVNWMSASLPFPHRAPKPKHRRKRF